MGEEFYANIKLISGEEILASVCIDESNDEPIIIAQCPVVMKMMNAGQGSYVKVKPWMELSNDEMFLIKPDKIITMSEIKDPKVIAIYERYCTEEEDDVLNLNRLHGEVNVSEDMGYVSSVEEARGVFEKLFNSPLKEDKES
tara:strand:+ start:450 stop:875 length:426 start_codon:yes stop_codon:yes gene_type:complete